MFDAARMATGRHDEGFSIGKEKVRQVQDRTAPP